MKIETTSQGAMAQMQKDLWFLEGILFKGRSELQQIKIEQRLQLLGIEPWD